MIQVTRGRKFNQRALPDESLSEQFSYSRGKIFNEAGLEGGKIVTVEYVSII